MIDALKAFYDAVSIIDLIYLVITILSLITCYKKGFVLSILSMAKWLLAYVITLILFPRVKPYFKDIIDNERSEEHTSELQSRSDLVCRLLLEKKKNNNNHNISETQH